MRIIEKEELKQCRDEILSMLNEGRILIYPTDTIYGIGCDATNEESVSRVRDIKERPDKPFSVIAPSKEWVYENCEVSDKKREWVERLPGPYTLILKLKDGSSVAGSVNPARKTIGVRIPDHWIADLVREFGKPVITPSANVSGHEFMTSLENLDPKLKSMSHLLLYEGEVMGQPSTIVNLAGEDTDTRKERKII